MKPTFKAYLAGFFDGEGCIMIIKDERTKAPSTKAYYKLAVAITQKDPGSLFEEIIMHFGGNKIYRPLGVWQWWLSSVPKATKMLMKLLPYIRLKRDQAILGIVYGGIMKAMYPLWNTQFNSDGRRIPYPREFVKWQDACWKMMRDFKKAPASETERMGRFLTIEELKNKGTKIVERMRQSTNQG